MSRRKYSKSSKSAEPLKAREKISRKMSKDGVIERNAVTGEDIRISTREMDADLKGGKQPSETFFQLDKRGSVPGVSGNNAVKRKKQKNRRIAEHKERTEARTESMKNISVQPEVSVVVPVTPIKSDTSDTVQADISEQGKVKTDQPPVRAGTVHPAQSDAPHIIPHIKAKPPTEVIITPTITERSPTMTAQTEKIADTPRFALRHDDGGKLQFNRENKPVPSSQRQYKAPQKREPDDDTRQTESGEAVDVQPETAQMDRTAEPSAFRHDDGSNLQFSHVETPVPISPQRQKPAQKQKQETAEQRDSAAVDNIPPEETIPESHEPATKISAPRSALKHEIPSRLHFEPINTDTPPLIKPKQKPVPKQTTQPAADVKTADTPITEQRHDAPDSPNDTARQPDGNTPPSQLKHEKPSKLHFEPDNAEVPPLVVNIKKQPVSDQAEQPNDNAKQADTQFQEAQQQPQSANNTPPITDNADTPIRTESANTPLKPDKPGKLQFADDEPQPAQPTRAEVKQQIRYGKAREQADRAVEKLEAAKSKLPAKKKLRSERVLNEETGKPKRRLRFENEVIPQSEHLKGAKPLRPVKAAGNALIINAHRKVYQVEHENVGVKAAHRAEMATEGIVRGALHHHKTAPYKKVTKLEHAAQKKSVNAAYQKALAENPKLKSNIISRAFQKRKIKKEYAKAAREAQKTAKKAKQAGTAAARIGKAIAGVIKRHPVTSAVIVLILLLLFCLMSLIGTFGSMGGGGMGAILTASYLAEDADIDDAETAYTEWEIDLQRQIANAESTHSGYDEYRYSIGDISHNPYELMAYLTVRYQNFTYAAIEADLLAIFNEQYTLTFTPSVETRYADPADADGDGDYEPYDWHVMTVTLTARSFTDVVVSRLSGDQLAHYALLLQTKGSRQYAGNPFGDVNWTHYVTSYYGYRIHPISGEKDLHRGVDIAFAPGSEILSAQDGAVTFAGYSGDYGNIVIIENSKGLVTKYAHCETLLVSTGQTVSMGDVIATVGSTGASTGPHLHFEVLKDGVYLNPLYFADTGSFSLGLEYGYAGTPMGDGSFAALMEEAVKYIGYPYVWGGSSPATSFDCSGYVSWVLTQSGVKNTGRLTAQGLFNISNPVSPADAQPGDLIFFHSTYSTANTVTHVGIYVGTDASGRPRMLHCGDPIGYVYIDTTYWQNHFYAFGRITD